MGCDGKAISSVYFNRQWSSLDTVTVFQFVFFCLTSALTNRDQRDTMCIQKIWLSGLLYLLTLFTHHPPSCLYSLIHPIGWESGSNIGCKRATKNLSSLHPPSSLFGLNYYVTFTIFIVTKYRHLIHPRIKYHNSSSCMNLVFWENYYSCYEFKPPDRMQQEMLVGNCGWDIWD